MLIIGLEVHVQLQTQTKVFCGCLNKFNPDHPNTQVCPVCLGLPGALPVLNDEAVNLSIRAGLGMGCEIAEVTKWDRKQYFYPDLPKGYQTSQYDMPICGRGEFTFDVPTEDGGVETKTIRINRAHLEEDAGKNQHGGPGGTSRVDLNRAGTPLLEIVTEPDFRSAAEAKAFLTELRLLMRYLGVSDCNMQEGSLRCDANINLKLPSDSGELVATPIVEVKNLNSFRGVEQAILYEEKRQSEEFAKTGLTIDSPGALKTTRGFNLDTGVTTEQREKEGEADYRYFPCPDLLPVKITADRLDTVKDTVCERPADRRHRFINELGLSDYDANVLIDAGRPTADYFETTATICGDAKPAANWVTQDVARELNEQGLEISDFVITAETLGELLRRLVAGELANKGAREVFADLLNLDSATPDDVGKAIDKLGLAPADSGEIEAIADAVIAANEKAAADVREGKDAAVGPMIGQVMKQLKGADPKTVRALLIERIRAN